MLKLEDAGIHFLKTIISNMQILFNNNQSELKKSTDILNDFIQRKEALVNYEVIELVNLFSKL